MADRRMLSSGILSSDTFNDLPVRAQILYVQINLNADDEGLIASIKRVARMYGADTTDVEALESSGLVIVFPSGVAAVTDWKIHNGNLRADRTKPSLYPEAKRLRLLPSGRYTIADPEEVDEVKKTKTDQKRPKRGKCGVREDKIREDKIREGCSTRTRARERGGAASPDSDLANSVSVSNPSTVKPFGDVVKEYDGSGIDPDLFAAIMKGAETLDAELKKTTPEVIDLLYKRRSETPLIDRQTDGLIFGRKALGDGSDYESNREAYKELIRIYGAKETLKAVEIAVEAGHGGEVGYIKGVLRRRAG